MYVYLPSGGQFPVSGLGSQGGLLDGSVTSAGVLAALSIQIKRVGETVLQRERFIKVKA